MDCIKTVVVGDKGHGDLGEYIPTVFDNYAQRVTYNNHEVWLGLWSTSGQEDYPRLRPLSYPTTDVFLVCFSVDSRRSFESVRATWAPETMDFCPEASCWLLVGTKSDLRDDPNTLARLAQSNTTPVARQEGIDLALQLGAAKYVECSAMTGQGMHELFEETVPWAMWTFGEQHRREFFKPILPPPPEAPAVHVPPSTFADDMRAMLRGGQFADLEFFCRDSCEPLRAHRAVLVCGSSLFRDILLSSRHRHSPSSNTGPSAPQDEAATQLGCTGISSVGVRESNGAEVVVVRLADHVTRRLFSKVLEFIYAGAIKALPRAQDAELADLTRAAKEFDLPMLVEECEHVAEGLEGMNYIVCKAANMCLTRAAGELLLGKTRLSDAVVRAGGASIPAHRVFLCGRCPFFSAALGGGFSEATTGVLELGDASPEACEALLEFVYTDCSPTVKAEPMELLVLAHTHGLDRLTCMCVSCIAEAVTKAPQAYDLCGLLESAQLVGVQELEEFMMHSVCVNYGQVSKKDEFSRMSERNREHAERNQWPPAWYLAETETNEQRNPITKRALRSIQECSVM
eukprot:m51a1_g13815 putative rho-related protein raca-like (571) ;mRNA; r:414260-416437